jgi:hypothetical protein
MAWVYEIFRRFVDKCHDKDYYIDENFLVRCLVAIASNQAKFDKMSRMNAEILKNSWNVTKKGVQNTINFLKNMHMLIVLVYYHPLFL